MTVILIGNMFLGNFLLIYKADSRGTPTYVSDVQSFADIFIW